MQKMWSTVTVAGMANGTDLEIYLRRSIKMLKQNRSPYSAELKVQVYAEELGVNLDFVFKDLDLNLDSEVLIKQILKEKYRGKKCG